MRQRGHTRGAARHPSRRYTQSAPEDQLPQSPAAQSASSISSLARQRRKKEKTNTLSVNCSLLLTFAWARALISAEAFITSISHALFTLRSFPTSGASGLRLCAGTTSKYDATSDPDPVPRSSSSSDARCLRER